MRPRLQDFPFAGLGFSRAIGAACTAAAFLAVAATFPAHAADKGLTISDTWIRLVMPLHPAAGYFTLSNNTGNARVLVGASSPDCGALMLHKSVSRNGQDQMVMAHEVSVPVHGVVKFAPGGYHLMCMKPSPEVKPGNAIPVTLKFKDGATLSADFQVRGATGK